MGIASSVSFRRFLAMLFAVTMIIAPLAMPVGQAMAATVSSHHDEMEMADHCGGKAGQDQPGNPIDHGCCAAMCLGIAMPAAYPDKQLAHTSIALRPSADRFYRGFLGEIVTPPPRLA